MTVPPRALQSYADSRRGEGEKVRARSGDVRGQQARDGRTVLWVCRKGVTTRCASVGVRDQCVEALIAQAPAEAPDVGVLHRLPFLKEGELDAGVSGLGDERGRHLRAGHAVRACDSRHSFMHYATTVKTRRRRPPTSVSLTKSIPHASSGACTSGRGAWGTARRLRAHVRTQSHSSRESRSTRVLFTRSPSRTRRQCKRGWHDRLSSSDLSQWRGGRESPETPDARVPRVEAMLVDEMLPDRHGVAGAPGRAHDQLAIGLAGARRRRPARSGELSHHDLGGYRVGGHSSVVAGLGGGHPVGRRPRRWTATFAALRCRLIVSRRRPVADSMRRCDHPVAPARSSGVVQSRPRRCPWRVTSRSGGPAG